MPKTKEQNHELMLCVMKEEFLKEGYEKASMRKIAQKCGLSASSFYRHFASKEDMFDTLMKPLVLKMDLWSIKHASTKYNEMQRGNITKETMFDESLIDLVENVIYPEKEMYCLLFYKAQGSKYENYLEELIHKEVQEMMHVFEVLKKAGIEVKEPLEEELYVLLHAYINAILEPVYHNYSAEKMRHSLETTKTFFLAGWMNLMGLQEET